MNDKEDSRLDDDEPDDALAEGPGHGGVDSWPGLVIQQGFTRSLLPGPNANMPRIVEAMTAPWHERMQGLTKAAVPTINYASPVVLHGSPDGFQAMTQQWSQNILGDLRKSLGPVLDSEVMRGFRRRLLPPNLRDHVDEVSASQVYDFLQEEGIPLYLIPRGTTAVRLLRAPDHQARRKVISNRYEALIEDCEAVLNQSDHPAVSDEVLFILDGLGAMRAGHTRSAQALFTVTLDTLIYRFYPDRGTRTKITNRKKDADVPDLIDSMGVHRAFVWLPIWNAHEEFWKHKGDRVPRYYSRHASVHGVSNRQFSKRNCVQALMLVTSLIGYADRLVAHSA